MTIKGKRAGALRKMPEAEAASYTAGAWEDGSFPGVAVHAAVQNIGIYVPAFDAYFSRRLGAFRAMAKLPNTSRAEEHAWIDEAAEYIQQARLRLGHLPSGVRAYINEVDFDHDDLGGINGNLARLDNELESMWVRLVQSQQKLQAEGATKGAPPKKARDLLLHDVAHYLQDKGVAATVAASTAASALRAVGVDVTDDPKKARGIVRAVEVERAEK